MPGAAKIHLGFLRSRKTILTTFLIVTAANSTIVAAAIGSNEAWGFGILTLLVYLALAWFACKRQVISIWAISVIILYEASGPFISGLKTIATTPADNLVLNLGIIAVSGYLLYGALVIFLSRHQCE